MQRGILASVMIGTFVAIVCFQPNGIRWLPRPISSVAAEATGIDAANGQILQIEGEVRLQRQNGQTVMPTTGMLLYPGDRLQSSRGGRAFVQCSDLSIDSVGDSFSGSNPCASMESLYARRNNGLCEDDAYRCPHRGDNHETNETLPYVIGPRRTNLLNPRPLFRWNAVSGAQGYRVCLKETGVNLWCQDVSQAQMSYPEDEPPLRPGEEYLLTVETHGGAFSLYEPTLPGGVGFQLLDPQQVEQIEAIRSQIEARDINETAKALAIVFLYTENGLISEAIDILEGLVARGVDAVPIYDRLAWLYSDYLALMFPASEYGDNAMELSDAE